MTKKEAKVRKLAWNVALAEGRVLKYDAGKQLTSYPTIEARDTALAQAKAVGFPCEVVKVS